MFRSRGPAPDDAWEATVFAETRGNPDGANLNHYLEIEPAKGGTRRKVRVDRDLWESVSDGDAIIKRAGSPPTRP